MGKGAAGFVGGAEEAGLDTIDCLDYTGFAVDKHPVFGDDADLDTAAGEQVVQIAVAIAVE